MNDDFLRIQCFCPKPGCGRMSLQRHHRGHELMWIKVWVGRHHVHPWFRKLVDRYHEFHEDDCVKICDWHHAEVHVMYDRIIQHEIEALRKPLVAFTLVEGRRLSTKLRAACGKWLKKKTPGVNPKYRLIKKGK